MHPRSFSLFCGIQQQLLADARYSGLAASTDFTLFYTYYNFLPVLPQQLSMSSLCEDSNMFPWELSTQACPEISAGKIWNLSNNRKIKEWKAGS